MKLKMLTQIKNLLVAVGLPYLRKFGKKVKLVFQKQQVKHSIAEIVNYLV